jgi:hypothetical protein
MRVFSQPGIRNILAGGTIDTDMELENEGMILGQMPSTYLSPSASESYYPKAGLKGSKVGNAFV